MDNVGSVLQNVTLTSGLIDFSGFQEFQDLFGSEALVNTSYNLGVDLGTASRWRTLTNPVHHQHRGRENGHHVYGVRRV